MVELFFSIGILKDCCRVISHEINQLQGESSHQMILAKKAFGEKRLRYKTVWYAALMMEITTIPISAINYGSVFFIAESWVL